MTFISTPKELFPNKLDLHKSVTIELKIQFPTATVAFNTKVSRLAQILNSLICEHEAKILSIYRTD